MTLNDSRQGIYPLAPLRDSGGASSPLCTGYMPERYFLARIFPTSTAGWSNGSTPSRLAVLIDGAQRRHRRRALALLAEAFGPELHPPFGEALEPVGIGHGDGDRFSAFAGGGGKGGAHRGRKFFRRLAGKQRRQRRARAGADCLGVEA